MKLIGCTPDGTPDGETISGRRAHQRHLRHYSVHVLAITAAGGAEGTVVVRRREADAPRYPGRLTTTVGAHLLARKSPADVVTAAATERGIELGRLSYLGSFAVDDTEENEICTLWTTEVDLTRATGDFLTLDLAQLARCHLTPHLAESLKIWRAAS